MNETLDFVFQAGAGDHLGGTDHAGAHFRIAAMAAAMGKVHHYAGCTNGVIHISTAACVALQENDLLVVEWRTKVTRITRHHSDPISIRQ